MIKTTPFFMQDKSPASCGSLDRYYGRIRQPHKYIKGIRQNDLTDEEKVSYSESYDNETDRKDYE